ncbi:fluoride efflux transporter CrcB [Ornithinibacillus sp. 4-3]|uniref:Fluoride-specific ion channel FluC n=1 Tax=Ornithinibacillus sp. 4-3 TaxID=3231488 RepID=A0AB39HMN7_9BACI
MSKNIRQVNTYLLIGCGGMIGATLRYTLSFLLPVTYGFPVATFTANIIGCFLLGFIFHLETLRKRISPQVFTAITVGIIGSFTTFSAFSMEAVQLWKTDSLLALIYVLSSVFLGIFVCWLGYKCALRRKIRI